MTTENTAQNDQSADIHAATVTEIRFTDCGIYAAATCGKKSATVCIRDHGVQVVCHNAAHKVWGKFGRHFANIAEAIAAYKSPQMKAIIMAIDRRNA